MAGLFLYGANAALLSLVAYKVNDVVPVPYMDEIFHVPQAQAYCDGRWGYWDDKITTPPGLYLPVSALHRAFGSFIPCTPPILRSTNLIILALLPLLLHPLLLRIRRIPKASVWTTAEAIVISHFPVVWFFGFLYYTDLISLVSVLGCYWAALEGRWMLGGLTNVIWVCFIAASSMTRILRESGGEGAPARRDTAKAEKGAMKAHLKGQGGGEGNRLVDPDLEDSELSDVPSSLISLSIAALLNIKKLVPLLAAFIPVFGSFAAFLKWNGGIALGDKTNHIPMLHVVQIFYFCAFSGAFLAPLILGTDNVRRSVRMVIRNPTTLALEGIVTGSMIWIVHRFTFEHPFLLADNRHYAFYVWRKVFKARWWVRYLAVLGYRLAANVIWTSVAKARTTTLIPAFAYIVAICLTLIPTSLIEPRYFIIPYIILRLHIGPSPPRQGPDSGSEVARESPVQDSEWKVRVVLEGLMYEGVNLVTLWLFLYRPFKWPTEDGWMRFMW